MDKKEVIKTIIESVFEGWDSNFYVSVTDPDFYDEQDYDVKITYKSGQWATEHVFGFGSRINDAVIEFCVYEDIYEPVTDINLFQWLFFELTTRLESEQRLNKEKPLQD